MEVAIFGAQGYARGVYDSIKTIYPDCEIPFFIVSEIGINAPFLYGVPVREIAEVSNEMDQNEKDLIEVIIATPENIQDEIEILLESYGFHNHRRLDFKYWVELMEVFHSKHGKFSLLSSYDAGTDIPSLEIYMAKFFKDKALVNPPELTDYIYPIQVGAANTDIVLSDIRDNIGDNISKKNVNYCELTGLYWIWKNKLCVEKEFDDDKYYGLAQYRRMFVLSGDDLSRLKKNNIDVVLPYPMPYEPDINAHHKRYIKDLDWKALLKALKELSPSYYDYFEQVLKQSYLFNYNVILARKSVLRDYCEWLFPILERTEELSIPKGCDRSDRYIGYMGETLETLYFMKNSDKLKIVHTGCKLYV